MMAGSSSLAWSDMQHIADNARAALRELASAATEAKNNALLSAAKHVDASRFAILDANKADFDTARETGRDESFLDRLLLTDSRLDSIIQSLHGIASLDDPVGQVISSWERPNGLKISRVSMPLGVIAVIYESRPNVTIDAGALCLKSGNPVILRGGSESRLSSIALHGCLLKGIVDAGLPSSSVSLVETSDRVAVEAILSGLNGSIDVVIPRGGKSLISRVQKDARVPVIGHLEGLCHVYVDASADMDKAIRVVVNAKMRRTGVCGAAETLLIDRAVAKTMVPALTDALISAGCTVRGDNEVVKLSPHAEPANTADWSTEYLAPVISVGVVDGVDGAIDHIDKFGTSHTESIIAEDPVVVERFIRGIDSSIVMHNASTQFADGGEFGMGAEIGIATGRIHARGPVGLEQLTTYRYVVRGTGQIRP